MSTVTASARMTELSAIVGDQHVIEAPAKLNSFAIDGVTPAISVSPANVEEVAAVLRYAFERELVVVPAGGMVHQEIGNVPPAIDVLLRTERLRAIEHYDPGDLTIGIGAGTVLGDLQGLVRDQGQVFPVDIAHSDRVTIGGAMAISAQGPHKHFFGGLRDFCIGVRFVTADGVIAKGGGRVVKNVAGFDLMKLMIGSYGTLGVITAASFKLFPRPVQTRTFVCEFATLAEAIECRDRVRSSPLSPFCFELLSPSAAGSQAWTVAIRAGGSDRVLARYAKELGSQVTRTLEGAEEQQLWMNIEGLGEHAPVTASVSLPPSTVVEVLRATERACSENHLSCSAWGRVAIGSMLLGFDNGMAEAYVATVSAIRAAVPRDASVVVTRCPSALKSDINVWGASPTNIKAMAAVKQAMNPKDTLNRGRFLL
jgi:glycolate oxidase FAD binding subunit